MDNRLLFVVPIYATSQKVFEKKWENRLISSKDGSGKIMRKFEPDRFSWKYNQVVTWVEIRKGIDFIEVVLFKRNGDVRFNYVPRTGFVSEHPHSRPNNHFYVSRNDTNESIKERILSLLYTLIEHEFESRFIDLEAFNSQYELMDIKGLFYVE